MSYLTDKFLRICTRTDLAKSYDEEQERYLMPPRLAEYINWWWGLVAYNNNFKDGIDENNPYGKS